MLLNDIRLSCSSPLSSVLVPLLLSPLRGVVSTPNLPSLVPPFMGSQHSASLGRNVGNGW